MNDFPFTDNNKRYHTLSYHMRSLGVKLHKAAVNCGMTCPNADGTCGTGGCIFCADGSRLFTADSAQSVTEQLRAEEKRIKLKHPDAELCAYFQTNSNTYAPPEKLRRLYDEAVSYPGVRALAIGTRPDCLPPEVLEVLEETAEKIPLTVELGLQTADDSTAALINRGYGYGVFESAFSELRRRGIRICVHIINGLPGEREETMLATAEKVGGLRPDGLKIHSLYIAQGTTLAEMYLRGEYEPMSFDGYVGVTARQLEYMPAETVIERLTGDGDRRTLLAPMWSADKKKVLAAIDRKMEALDITQGDLAVSV